MVLLHLAALLGYIAVPAAMQDAGYLYDSIFGWAIASAFWSAVAAAAMVYFQALTVNRLADDFRLMEDRSWLPGMGYALVASSLPDFQFLSPPLVAATFVVFALRRIFLTYKSPKSTLLIFDAAFWVAISSLFYPKAIFLVVAVYLGINVTRSWNFKGQVAFWVGVLAPVFLGWLYYFWLDVGAEFRSQHFGALFSLFHFDLDLDKDVLLKGALMSFFFLLFIVNLFAFTRNKSMNVQKYMAVLFWFFVIGSAIILLRPAWRWEVFALTAAPSGIFLAMAYQNMRKGFSEILHLILLGFVLLIQFSFL